MTVSVSIQLNDFHPGSTFQLYRLLEQIGSSGQGVVWSALDSFHQRTVAIKFNEILTSDLETKDGRVFERQADQLVELIHPHVLPPSFPRIDYLYSTREKIGDISGGYDQLVLKRGCSDERIHNCHWLTRIVHACGQGTPQEHGRHI